MTEIELFLDKTVEENAALYFEKAKKFKKKIEGAKTALNIYENKLKDLERKKAAEIEEYEEKNTADKAPVKKEWYEKFRWFISSEGNLIIGGRDATTNEMIIKKYTDKNDLVFHTDLAGSPFFVIKTDGKKPGDATMQEVADATITFSRAFKLGQINTPVFYVSRDQVTKEANSGEYLTKGAFVIRGKTNYIDNKINLAVGKLEDGRLMAAPVEAVKKHCKEYLILEQGDEKPSEIAKKIKAKLAGKIDDIIRILPSGEMRIKK